MLYTDAKRYLLDKLKEAGLKSRPYTSQKTLENSRESHIGAVIFEKEAYARNGSKKRFRDEEGAKHKRRKVFDRDITFMVTIGDYTDDAVETMLDAFISGLDAGICVDGDFASITVDGGDWVDKDDSILKAQVAVQVLVTFHGGVYKDTDFGPLTHVEVVGIEKNNGKETTDGN